MISLSLPYPLLSLYMPPPHLQNACRLVSEHPHLCCLSNGSTPDPHLMQPLNSNSVDHRFDSHKWCWTKRSYFSWTEPPWTRIQSVTPISLCVEHTRSSRIPCVFSRRGHSYHAFLNMRPLWRRTVTTPGSEQGLQGPLFAQDSRMTLSQALAVVTQAGHTFNQHLLS